MTGLPGTPGRCSGLVSEWLSEDGQGWFGRVVYAVVEAGRVMLVEAWLPAEYLAPASPRGWERPGRRCPPVVNSVSLRHAGGDGLVLLGFREHSLPGNACGRAPRRVIGQYQEAVAGTANGRQPRREVRRDG